MSEVKERPQPWAEAKGDRHWRNPLVVFIWIEWICEWIAYGLSRWAFISILDYLGRLAIVLAIVSWIVEIPQRKQTQAIQRKAKIFQAWQVINTAQGKPGDGGRRLALRDLMDEQMSLGNVDLSLADLGGCDLRRADLHGAHLREAVLKGANLRRANLRRADLRGAILGADLNDLFDNFYGAKLDGALDGADLRFADLFLAKLDGARFGNANLDDANLTGATLGSPNSKFDYDDVTWMGVKLRRANIWRIKAPKGFVDWAIREEGAVAVADPFEWKAMLADDNLYEAWRQKWLEEHGKQCQTNADCDDGIWCNGEEVCETSGPRICRAPFDHPCCPEGVHCGANERFDFAVSICNEEERTCDTGDECATSADCSGFEVCRSGHCWRLQLE